MTKPAPRSAGRRRPPPGGPPDAPAEISAGPRLHSLRPCHGPPNGRGESADQALAPTKHRQPRRVFRRAGRSLRLRPLTLLKLVAELLKPRAANILVNQRGREVVAEPISNRPWPNSNATLPALAHIRDNVSMLPLKIVPSLPRALPLARGRVPRPGGCAASNRSAPGFARNTCSSPAA